MLHGRVQNGGPADLQCTCVYLHGLVPRLYCVSEKAATVLTSCGALQGPRSMKDCKAVFDETGVVQSTQYIYLKWHAQSFGYGHMVATDLVVQ